jgi:hypothetical protein
MIKIPVSNEILFLRSPNINICHRIIIQGEIKKQQIEDALQKVCIRHPLLKCSIETDKDNNKWFVQNVESIKIEYYKSTDMDWQLWYKKSDSIPFDILRGPLVRFCVIFGNNIEIIILGHHIIGDGVACINLDKDILSALDGNIDETPQMPPVDIADRNFNETVLLDYSTKVYAGDLNAEWRKNRGRLSENEYRMFFKQYRDKYRPNFYLNSIDEKSYGKIMKICKKNELKVNELFISAFSAAILELSDYYPDNKIRIGIAVDIRNELVSKPYCCMGNYLSGISVKINYDPANEFIINTINVSNKLREYLNNLKKRHAVIHLLNEFDKDLIETIVLAAYGSFNHPISKRLAEFIGEKSTNKCTGISNLGRHDFGNYKNFTFLDLQFIGPAFPANFLTIDIVTVNNKMNICIRYNEDEIAIDTVKRIYERANILLQLNGLVQ